MRIIGGELKGKSFNFLKSKTTRPLKDSVKENIFNILSHSKILNTNIKKSKVLDLYSGVGSFGLECISRGANNVTFVEKENIATEILKDNISKLSIKNKVVVEEKEIYNFLKESNKKKFDIFFLDPPFKDKNYVNELQIIFKTKIYKKKHTIIIHREKNSKDELHHLIKTLIVKVYGRSKLIFGTFIR